jgi:hypothetical protein
MEAAAVVVVVVVLFAGQTIIRAAPLLAPFLLAPRTSCLVPDLQPLQGFTRHWGQQLFPAGKEQPGSV